MAATTIEKEIIFYYNHKGEAPVVTWLSSLDNVTQKRIQSRILRITSGNYGDFKRLNKDVYELRLDFGAGYRVYFAEVNDRIVLLLCGGDKKTQNKDIEKAINYYNEYQGTK